MRLVGRVRELNPLIFKTIGENHQCQCHWYWVFSAKQRPRSRRDGWGRKRQKAVDQTVM